MGFHMEKIVSLTLTLIFVIMIIGMVYADNRTSANLTKIHIK